MSKLSAEILLAVFAAEAETGHGETEQGQRRRFRNVAPIDDEVVDGEGID